MCFDSTECRITLNILSLLYILGSSNFSGFELFCYSRLFFMLKFSHYPVLNRLLCYLSVLQVQLCENVCVFVVLLDQLSDLHGGASPILLQSGNCRVTIDLNDGDD